jgi:hypothetical protein
VTLQNGKTSRRCARQRGGRKRHAIRFFGFVGRGRQMKVCGQQSGVAFSGVNCRLYISSLTIFSKYSALYPQVSNSTDTTAMTMNVNLQDKCYNGDIRYSFLVFLGQEKQIIPYTPEMCSNYNSSKSTELVHQEIAAAFGLPHNALFTITYINNVGKEAVFPLCVVRLGSNMIVN